MKVRRYKKTDYEMISSWLDARQLDHYPQRRLPKTGFIVEDVAAAFLLKTDGKIGIIDYFASNPKCSDELKLEAYDLLFPKLETTAAKLGFEILMASTNILKVAVLAIRAGMIKDPEYYMMLRKKVPLPLKEPSDGRINTVINAST